MVPDGIHVIYGTGPAGRHVAAELLGRGIDVRMVSRHEHADLPARIEAQVGDVTVPGFATAAAKDAAVLYGCVNPPDYHKWGEQLLPMFRGVLGAATGYGTRLVLLDNLYAYGPTSAPMRPDTPEAATDPKGRLRATFAAEARAAHERGDAVVAIVRASDFVGPALPNAVLGARVIPRVIEGHRVRVLGDPDQLHTYTAIGDVGRALAAVGLDADAYGRTWLVGAPETITTRAYIERFAAAAGTAARVRGGGRLLLRVGGVFSPLLRTLQDTLYQFEAPYVVDGSAYRDRFADPGTPIDEVVAATVLWYRSRGRS